MQRLNLNNSINIKKNNNKIIHEIGHCLKRKFSRRNH